MDTDKKYMQICLELAEKGRGKVSPNPMVGAVIVKNGQIIAQGYHRYFGGTHAEIEALRKAKDKAKKSTLYVNLEPCCHMEKKTPPCVPEIIKAGIKKVVIAMKDPNPLVNGKGIKQLKIKNVKLKIGVLGKEAKELNRAYIKFISKKMPYVILKSAMTLDGKIATSTGKAKWITSLLAREYTHRLRSEVDAILVGKNTVLRDNPSLTTHQQSCLRFRASATERGNPLRIVIDPDLSIPKNSKIFNSLAQTLIITKDISSPLPPSFERLSDNVILTPMLSGEESQKYFRHKRDSSLALRMTETNIKVIGLPAKNGKIDFRKIMQELAKMNIASVLIEGGGETNALALRDGIVDEIMFFIAPKIVGGKNALTPVEGRGIENLQNALKIKDLQIEKIGPDFLLRGKIPFA